VAIDGYNKLEKMLQKQEGVRLAKEERRQDKTISIVT
jgi:hypothetical protein